MLAYGVIWVGEVLYLIADFQGYLLYIKLKLDVLLFNS